MKEIFRISPTPSVILKPGASDFYVNYVNDAYLELANTSYDDLADVSLIDFFSGRSSNSQEYTTRLAASLQKVLTTKKRHKLEVFRYDLREKDSEEPEQRYWSVVNSPVFDDEGEIEYILHSVIDVTNQVLKEADNQLFLKNTGEGFLLVDKKLKIINFNHRFKKDLETLLGGKLKTGQSVLKYVLPERRGYVKQNYEKVIQGKRLKDRLKLPLKNDDYRIYDIQYSPARGADNEIYGVFASFRDVTQELKAKEELKVSEAKYRALVENGNDVVFIISDKHTALYISPSVKKVLGYDAEALMKMDIFTLIHPDDMAHVENELQLCLNKPGEVIDVPPTRMLHKDKSWRWFKGTISNRIDDAVIGGIVNNFREITQKVEAEIAHEFERKNREALINSTEDLIWSVDRNLKLIAANNAASQGFKQSVGKKIKSGDFILSGLESNIQYRNEWEQWYKRVLSGESFRIETHHPSLNEGFPYWFETSFNPIWDNDEIVGIACYSRNISESKRTEQKLKEADQKLRNIVEHSTNMFYQHDLDGVFTYLSPQCEEFLGFDFQETPKRWHDFLTAHPYNKLAEERTERAIETGVRQPPYELQLKKADGEKIWVEVNEAPILDNGRTVSIVGSLTNITDRKDYEAKLQESLERYSIVSKATSDTIWDLNIENDRMLYNVNIYKMFGYKETEVENMSSWWKEKIHPDDVKLVNEILFNILNGNQKRFQLAYRFKSADGSYKYIYDRAFVLKDDSGKPIRMIGAMQDITVQKEREQQIEESLKEKETLLAEIHHRVKNNLAVVSGMMQLQVFEAKSKVLKSKLLDSVSRIQTMGAVHELLYQSNNFSKLEFSESLKKLLENITETMQSTVDIDINYDCQPLKLNITKAIPVSLIVNEVVTNIFKYAFKGRKEGMITFTVRNQPDKVLLSIADNGVGLPENFDDLELNSLGIKLIKVLTQQVEGEYSYKSNGSGTVFTLEFNPTNLN